MSAFRLKNVKNWLAKSTEAGTRLPNHGDGDTLMLPDQVARTMFFGTFAGTLFAFVTLCYLIYLA